MTARPHIFTVDVEDWYQGLDLDMAEWPRFAPRLETGLSRLLGLLDDFGARATFFVVGWQADRTPALIREVARQGHEIACHGYSHRFVYRLTPAQFREEVRRSRGSLEAIVGEPVVGFRAPFFSITARALWALDVLVEEGFRYDSSIFPVWNHRYGLPGAARQPGLVVTPAGAELFEIPLSTVRLPVGINVPVSGGAYFRLYPYGLTRTLIRRLERAGDRLIFYAHPWEYDPGHPRIRLPSPRVPAHPLREADSMTARTRRLLGDFRFVAIREAYAAEIAAATRLTAEAAGVRVYVLTQEDAFYIPRLLDQLLGARRDVIAIGVVPGELRAAHAGRYWRLMGPRAFTLQLANLARHRALGLAGRILPLRRSYSVRDAARRHGVAVETVPAVNAPAFVSSLRARGVSLLVSIACPQILRRDVLRGAGPGRDQPPRRAAPGLPGPPPLVLGPRQRRDAHGRHRALHERAGGRGHGAAAGAGADP